MAFRPSRSSRRTFLSIAGAASASVWIPKPVRGYSAVDMRAMTEGGTVKPGVSKWELDTPALCVDLDKMETVIRVNGKETGRFHTNEMIFGVVPFIVELTKYFTLWPGDVIWMGTDGASPDIKAGDVVEIDITGIGTLRNRFVKEKV